MSLELDTPNWIFVICFECRTLLTTFIHLLDNAFNLFQLSFQLQNLDALNNKDPASQHPTI